MTRTIVAIPKDNEFVEFPTPDNGIIAYKTRFGTIVRDHNAAHNVEVKEYLDRGICPECGENHVIEDIEMCESCRNKVKRMWGGLNSVMDSYNGHIDVNWEVRRSWETKKEHADRVKTTCPCCGNHKDADKGYCEKCLDEIKSHDGE